MQKVDALKKRIEILENQPSANNNMNSNNNNHNNINNNNNIVNGFLNLKYFSSNNSNMPGVNNSNIKTLLPNDNELSKCTNDVLQSLYVLFKNDLNKLDKVSFKLK